MRSLAIILYLVITGCFVLATSLVELIELDYYTEDIEEDYLWQADLISRLILPELYENPEKQTNILSYWKQQIEGKIQNIDVIDTPKVSVDAPSHPDIYISEMIIDEYTDLVSVIVSLDDPHFANKSLRLNFVDAYSDRYNQFDADSTFAVYVFMALVISVIALIIYRYMNKISQVTQAVASGDYNKRMPSSRVPSLQVLADDINVMAKTIEEKGSENIILTGAIHHELRIPVTRVRLALDMALGHKDINEIKNLLEDMDVDLEELVQLMEEILTISRLSLRSEKIPTSLISVKESIGNVLENVNNPLISLCCESDLMLTANKTLFERAIFNVITNAEKYAQQDVRVVVRKERDFACIDVEDDGPGIPENEYKLVLKPFYRTDKSRNRSTGGVGLGLAIADMVIKHTAGTIIISRSNLGGTKISLRWANSFIH